MDVSFTFSALVTGSWSACTGQPSAHHIPPCEHTLSVLTQSSNLTIDEEITGSTKKVTCVGLVLISSCSPVDKFTFTGDQVNAKRAHEDHSQSLNSLRQKIQSFK